jgi:hypothetical protein
MYYKSDNIRVINQSLWIIYCPGITSQGYYYNMK